MMMCIIHFLYYRMELGTLQLSPPIQEKLSRGGCNFSNLNHLWGHCGDSCILQLVFWFDIILNVCFIIDSNTYY